MTSSENKVNKVEKAHIPPTEAVFKYLVYIIVGVMVLCIPGFLRFRTYCQEKGYYVFSIDAIKWCILGFFLVSMGRYTYYKLMRKPIQAILKPKYEGEEKLRKIEMLLKLSYDTFFYSTSTIICYVIFTGEYWFPMSAGGVGSCSQIYKEYPDWPTDKRWELEIYFMFHLGVHMFSIFQLLTVRRSKERKFYEWMLHHFVASTLILFSMMCNEVAAGVMTLIVHDASDIFLAGGRFYFEAHFPKNKVVTAIILVSLFLVWIYLRLVVYPFCLLASVYVNKPEPTDEWYIINYEYLYLLSMAFLLVAMHIYWTFYMFKSAYISLNKKEIVNDYDVHKKK